MPALFKLWAAAGLFGPVLAKAEDCPYVPVVARAQIQSQNFAQRGTAWVFADAKSQARWVGTAAHVVQGFSNFEAYCGRKKLKLRLIATDLNLDLALLEIEGSAKGITSALKLFDTPPTLPAELRQPGTSQKPAAVREKSLFGTLIGFLPNAKDWRFIQIAAETSAGPRSQFLPSDSHFLYVHTGARPGLSGSPLLFGNRPPLGMLLKIRNEDSLGLALPTPVVVRGLRAMAENKKISSPHRDHGLTIESRLELRQGKLQRVRSLKTQNERWEEVCENSALTPAASAWDPAKGGDWGDGGGSTQSKRKDPFHSQFEGLPGALSSRGVYLGFPYVADGGCVRSGLRRLRDNRIVIALKETNGSLRELRRLEDLELSPAEVLSDAFVSRAIFEDQATELHQHLCSQWKQAVTAGTWIDGQRHDAAIRDIEVKLTSEATQNVPIPLAFFCQPEGIQSFGQWSQNGPDFPSTIYQARLNENHIELHAVLGSCIVKEKVLAPAGQKFTSSWQVETTEARFRFEISPEWKEARVTISRIHEKCLPGARVRPWMIQVRGVWP